MSEQIKQIAARLFDLREIEGISAEALAKEFNISPALYRSYESGETDIPVSFLYEAANHFGVELVELLNGEAPKLHVCQFVKKGKGLPVERSKQYRYKNLAFNFLHKKAEPFLVTVDADEAEIHTNEHPGQEFDYCLSGRILIIVNGKEFILEEGDSIYYDSNYPHGMKALDGKPAEFLAVIF